MSDNKRTFSVGQAQITVINIGDIHFPLGHYLNISHEEAAARADVGAVAAQMTIPIYNIHIQLPQTSILVDAGSYDAVTSDSEYFIADYTPPPSLISQLNGAGIDPAKIEHIVITHRHWDHFNGTTEKIDTGYAPIFPNAQFYLGRIDWERSEVLRQDLTTIEARTLQVLHDHKVLTLVDEQLDMVEGVQIIHAPGETRGHQIVRVQSEGETLYCVGDLYNHPLEILEPHRMVGWARPETMRQSRQQLVERALSDNGLILATHMRPIGRLQKNDDQLVWQPIY